MAKAVLLTNPDLNDEDVTVTHSAAQGREVGVATADAGNTEQLRVVSRGDPGDDDDHTFRVGGPEEIPTYRPDDQYTQPSTYVRHVAKAVSGIRHGYAVAAFDRLCVVTVAKTGTSQWQLKIWQATAADITQVAVRTINDLDETKWDVTSLGVTCIRHGSVVTASIFIKDIVNADARASRIRFFRINLNATTPAWGTIGTRKIVDMVPGFTQSTDFVGMDGHHDIEHDGNVWMVAFQIRESNNTIASTAGSHSEVMVCTGSGPLGVKFDRHFGGSGTDWWWQPKLCHSPHWGFILTATQAASNTTTRSIRTRHTKDSSTWENLIDAPGVSARVFNDWGIGCATENRRLYIFWNDGDGSDDTKMKWFNGDEDDSSAWSTEVAVNVGAQLDGDSFIGATNWRGEICFATRASSGGAATDNVEVIRGNQLTTTNTAIERELPLGERVFIDGPMDETRVGLFVTATGTVVEGDSWTIPVLYQFEGLNVLREALGETWRTDDNGTPDIVLDAGSGLAFVVDAVALFGINLPAWTFQMNDSDSWSSPTVSQSVSAVVSTVTVSSSKGNRVVMTTSPWERAQFVKRPHWVELSTGIFRILDNGDDYLIVDGSPGSPTGTATVFGDRAGHIFSSLNVHQFARIVAPSAKQTPDDFYEIARVIFGAALVLPQDYAIRWREERAALNEVVDLRPGARVAAALNARKRNVWRLRIPPAVEVTSIAPVRDFVSLADGVRHQIAWWPEGSGDAQACFLSRFGADALEAAHVMGTGAADRHDELPELIIREEV